MGLYVVNVLFSDGTVVTENTPNGLKDQLAATEDEEADELREEIEALEERIEELTEFRSGRSFHTSAGGS